MKVVDIYKIVDDDTKTHIMQESTGNAVFVRHWKDIPVGWMNAEVKRMSILPSGTLWITVELQLNRR